MLLFLTFACYEYPASWIGYLTSVFLYIYFTSPENKQKKCFNVELCSCYTLFSSLYNVTRPSPFVISTKKVTF